MGMRPTIGICLNGRIIDACMYKNWGLSSLLIEAFRLYVRYADCKTAEEYTERCLAEIRESHPDYQPPEDQEDYVDFVLNCSEFSLLVDLSLHCIYYGYCARTREELLLRPDSRTMMSTFSRRRQAAFDANELYTCIKKSVIWLDRLDVDEILRLAEAAGSFYQIYW